ncbi:MAG: response regulator [Burkholderiaceae bacterium]|nr:response regulator [Burkholderiaceae bacterium]
MSTRKTRILCIDDEAPLTALIEEELIEKGYEIEIAANGQQGLMSILQSPPDLVLCDINMPIMSGFELMTCLANMSEKFAQIPFIFLTAQNDRDTELRGRKLGAADFVKKPIDFEILHTIIEARLCGVARLNVWAKSILLSEREIEALTWSARGKTSAEIADLTGMAKRTVDHHLDSARAKLGVATRVEAVMKAILGKLIDP